MAKKKFIDTELHLTKSWPRVKTKWLFNIVRKGVVFVQKANMWLFYIKNNKDGVADTHEWFSTKQEAKDHERKKLS